MSTSEGSAFSRSRITWNLDPLFSSLSTVILPSMASTMCFVIAMPSPAPSVLCTRMVSTLE